MSRSTRFMCVMILAILPSITPAQEWVARYNSTGYDYARAIAVDEGGNVYVTGDYATIKYNSTGIEQWVVSNTGSCDAEAIALDGMGNVYVAGNIGADYGTIKYDSMGVEQWVMTYNGPAGDGDYVNAMVIDNSANVYVTGESDGIGTEEDYATVKYNSSGVEQWVVRYHGPGNDHDVATAITVDDASNVYVTGYSDGLDGDYDYATVMYDSSGIEQWVARYEGPSNYARAITLDASGNIYVTGESAGSGSSDDYATVKYDALGVEQWVARYNGPGNDWDCALAIAVDAVGNIYVTGASEGSGTGRDYATVKYNSSGIEQWVTRYNGPNNLDDNARAIAVDSPDYICITGQSQDDYATVKYDLAGSQLWVARYNGPGNGEDWADAIAVDTVGNIYVTGGSYGSGTGYDYATIKYSPTGIEEHAVVKTKGNKITATICSGALQLPQGKKCKVFDITGRVVEPDKIQTGIYFIEIDGVVTQKVVKVR